MQQKLTWLPDSEDSHHTYCQWGEYSEMWRNSKSWAAKKQNQKTRPRGQCGEAIRVTDNNDHKCGKAYCNRCNEDVVLYFGYHCFLPEGLFEKLTQNNLKCY